MHVLVFKGKTLFEFLDLERLCEDLELEEFVVSLEFAPLTKRIKISNIPQYVSYDSIKYKFSNPKTGGGKVKDMMLDTSNGVATVYFAKSSGRIMACWDGFGEKMFLLCYYLNQPLFSNIFSRI